MGGYKVGARQALWTPRPGCTPAATGTQALCRATAGGLSPLRRSCRPQETYHRCRPYLHCRDRRGDPGRHLRMTGMAGASPATTMTRLRKAMHSSHGSGTPCGCHVPCGCHAQKCNATDLRSLFVTQTEPSTSRQNGQPAKAEAPKIPVLGLEEGYAYFEGRIVPMSEAKVSIATHALQYG